jgi:metal-sulfur cluster biosynthetic enzyme
MTVNEMPDETTVFDALRQVEDPELGMDIVEIGLVYGVSYPKPGTVRVSYSLTSPACPAGPQITGDIVNTVRALPGVEEVDPDLVWSPPWTPDRMSDDAKFILGIG